MKIMPFLTAILVSSFLYMLVFERDALMAFAQVAADEGGTSEMAEEDRADIVSVVAMRSEAQVVDSAVVLRGRTEAARSVEARAHGSLDQGRRRQGIRITTARKRRGRGMDNHRGRI